MRYKDIVIGTEIDGGTDRATLNSLSRGQNNLCTTVMVMRLSAGFL